MTADEQRMLADLANKVAQTPAPPRDPEAEQFIRTQIGKRPDALYLMTQTVLIQNLALEQARRQIQELQARSGQTQSGSFLGQGQGQLPDEGPLRRGNGEGHQLGDRRSLRRDSDQGQAGRRRGEGPREEEDRRREGRPVVPG